MRCLDIPPASGAVEFHMDGMIRARACQMDHSYKLEAIMKQKPTRKAKQ